MKKKSSEYLERVSLELKDTAVFKNHYARYKFAEKFVKNRIVLDAGCGTGYGTAYLSRWADKIVGLDISSQAIDYARSHFQRENLRYQIMDCSMMALPERFFGVVCAFELIEHIPDYKKFLQEIQRVSKPGGVILISTPNKLLSPGQNPHHIKEFTPREFKDLLWQYFPEVKIYGQKASRRAKEAFYGTSLKRFLARLDFLRWHDLIPRRIYRVLSRIFGFAMEEDLTVEDYSSFSQSELEKAENLLAVCKKTEK